MSAWSNADVCTCWKHPSSNWLETLQFPAWRKMTFTCPCHWHKTNRKAITGHLELWFSCHGPVSEKQVAEFGMSKHPLMVSWVESICPVSTTLCAHDGLITAVNSFLWGAGQMPGMFCSYIHCRKTHRWHDIRVFAATEGCEVHCKHEATQQTVAS